MNESERPSTPTTPENVWKSIDGKEEVDMDITFTPDQLCAMARSRERLNIWVRRVLLMLLIGFAGVLAYMFVAVGDSSRNLLPVSPLWARLGIGWCFAWTCLLVWGMFREGPRRMSATDNCASFLQREFKAKRSGLIATQRYMLLVLIPPMLALWWGGGWRAARLGHWGLSARGVDPSSWLYQFAGGPWPFIILGLLLVLDWLAFGLAAQKATRELDELARRTQE
jgi:hypothetical protein